MKGYAEASCKDSRTTVANEVAVASETNSELNAIENIIDTLFKQSSVLNERLEYVSRPDSPAVQSVGGQAPVPSVPLAQRLANIRSQLSSLSARIENTTIRIDA